MRAISDEIRRLLSVQLQVDEWRAESVRRGGSRFVDFGYANSYDGPAPETVDALRRALDSTGTLSLQYTPYGGATVARRLVAESLRRSHALPFHLKDVVLTPGAMAALNVVFRSVREAPEDEVIVITPCWIDYPLYLENLGLRARLVPVHPDTLRLDLDAIAAALNSRTRAVILSQPANPSGLIYTQEELQGLAKVLSASDPQPLLISDECHRDLVFDDNRFVHPGQFYDATCTVYSIGKLLCLQGQRLGYVAVSPRHPQREALAELFGQLTRVMGFCTPTSLMQLAVGDLLQVRPRTEILARRRKLAIETLMNAGYELIPSEATFFLYPKVPGANELRFVEQLSKKGVMVLPAAVFHHTGRFRVSLTTDDEALEHGLSVLAAFRQEYS